MSVGKAMPDSERDRGGGAEESGGRTLFSAVITPHRSLDPKSFRIMMAVLCAVAALLGLRFLVFGFWPIVAFLCLDVIGLYVAFKISYARARGFEEVTLTPLELLLRRVGHRGDVREWRFNPLWTKLVRETHEEFGLQRLLVVSRGQTIAVGAALSPEERAHFADAFGSALGRAKRGV